MTQIQIGKHDKGEFWVWQQPQPGFEYILGADVAQGATFGEAREDGDYSTLCILKRDGFIVEQVAEGRTRIENFAFGEVIAAFGGWYNHAWVNVERNLAHGVIAGLRAAGYPVEKWYQPPLATSVQGTYAQQFFFHKNMATQKVMLDTLVDYLDPHGARLVIRSSRLRSELASLQREPDGKVKTNGKDLSIALAMAVVVDSTIDSALPVELPKPATPKAPFGVDPETWKMKHEPEKPMAALKDDAPVWGERDSISDGDAPVWSEIQVAW